MRKFQEGPPASGRKWQFAVGPNTPLGISWTFSKEKREMAPPGSRSVDGSKRPLGIWVLPITVIIITDVIIMIKFPVHSMIATGPGPKRDSEKMWFLPRGLILEPNVYPVTHSQGLLVPVVGMCLCALTTLSVPMSMSFTHRGIVSLTYTSQLLLINQSLFSR